MSTKWNRSLTGANMEDNWGRTYDFVALSAEQVASMLQPAFPGKHITSTQLLTAGHCNTNYKITLTGLNEAFVLRLYTRDRLACQKDVDIFQLVGKHNLIPEIIYADPDAVHSPNPYSVMKWVDGVLLSDLMETQDSSVLAECAYSAGATLASIGRYTFPQHGFFGPGLAIAQPFDDDTGSFPAIITHFLQQASVRQHLGSRFAERLQRFV